MNETLIETLSVNLFFDPLFNTVYILNEGRMATFDAICIIVGLSNLLLTKQLVSLSDLL